jgi:hypothetical protein
MKIFILYNEALSKGGHMTSPTSNMPCAKIERI